MLNHHTKARGEFKVSVIRSDTGEVLRTYEPQPNLILDSGMDQYATRSWFGCTNYCAIGTGTTPTMDTVSGTASQSSTTVTLAGSSYSFVSGDVGSWLKWSSGQEAKITAFTNATTVTVTPSQTVPSGNLVGIFRCGQTALDTEVRRTGGSLTSTAIWPGFTDTDNLRSQGMFFDATLGRTTIRRTVDHPNETGTVTYREVGMSWSASAGNLFSRVVLSSPVTVNNGEKLRVQYNLYVTSPFASTTARGSEVTLAITGWPYTYDISGIVSTGSDFTVTTTASHHFLSAGKVNIAGTTVSAYHAEWTIASVTSTTFTVTSALNPGTATGGTCFNNTKANGYQVGYPFMGAGQDVSNATAGAGWPVTNGFPSGWSYGRPWASCWDGAYSGSTAAVDSTSPIIIGFYMAHSRLTPPASIASKTTPTGNFSTASTATSLAAASYTNGNFYRDYTGTIPSGTMSLGTLRTLLISGGDVTSNSQTVPGLLFDFLEPQRKGSTSALNFTFRRSWSRALA